MSYRVVALMPDVLGEGPLWSSSDDAIYWVDVLAPALNRLSLSDGQVRRWEMPEPIGFIVQREDGDGFVVGLKSGLAHLQLDPFAISPLAAPAPHPPERRLNDGKVDPSGRLWMGSMEMDAAAPTGSLYRVGCDLRIESADDGYYVPNGPAIGRACFYHADSPRRVIYRFALADDGELSDRREFLTFPEAWGLPDGMTVDSEDHLWVAHWDGGRVSRFSPDGRLVRHVHLPASRITSITFAGPALDRAFVTSASLDRDAEPCAGALFEIDARVKGRPTFGFRIN
jgi:sugar lactone lactonase YvrE